MTLHHGDIIHPDAVADSVFIENGCCHLCREPLGQILMSSGGRRTWYKAIYDQGAQCYVVHECRQREAA